MTVKNAQKFREEHCVRVMHAITAQISPAHVFQLNLHLIHCQLL